MDEDTVFVMFLLQSHRGILPNDPDRILERLFVMKYNEGMDIGHIDIRQQAGYHNDRFYEILQGLSMARLLESYWPIVLNTTGVDFLKDMIRETCRDEKKRKEIEPIAKKIGVDLTEFYSDAFS